MVQLLSAYIVGPTMFINLTPALETFCLRQIKCQNFGDERVYLSSFSLLSNPVRFSCVALECIGNSLVLSWDLLHVWTVVHFTVNLFLCEWCMIPFKD